MGDTKWNLQRKEDRVDLKQQLTGWGGGGGGGGGGPTNNLVYPN